MNADIESCCAPLYRRVMTGATLDDVLAPFCETLARMLDAPLVLVCRTLDSGVVHMRASSDENLLWADLQRLPERWDGTIAGAGPAARAIQRRGPVWLPIADDGFLPWRRAAESEGVSAAGAWPLPDGHLLQVYARHESLFGEPSRRRVVDDAAAELETLLESAGRLARHELLAHALEQHASPAFVTDVEGSIVWINPAFSRVYGYAAQEALGRNPRMIQSGDHGLRYYRELWDTIRSGRAWHGETLDRGHDGTARTVWQTISPFGSDGRLTHYLAVHEDISELRRRQRERDLRLQQDPLTGLLTPEAFEQAVAASIEHGSAFALALLSLRGAGHLRRTVGSEAFEAALCEVCIRLRDVLGGQDACMPAPGEFQLMLRDRDEPDTTNSLPEKVTAALGRPFAGFGELDLQPRFGVARHPDDGASYRSLVKHADRQLACRPHPRARRQVRAIVGEP